MKRDKKKAGIAKAVRPAAAALQQPAAPTAPTNAAIYYQQDAFSTNVPKLMGRNAAGAGFLSAFARHARVPSFLGYAASAQEFGHFRDSMRGQKGNAACKWIQHGSQKGLTEAGTLFVYAPGVADFCWQRRFATPAAWSVVGLTHTISSERVMEDIGNLVTGPVERWDALICTSNSVRRTVQGVAENYAAYLAERFNARKIPLRAELPVIPLGVDCDAFAGGDKRAQQRVRIRERLGLKADDVVFMFLGRLSFHAKAHPLPMYLALEAAAKRTGRRVTLILLGYFFNAGIQKQFLDGAKRFCPSVRLLHIDGRKADARASAWAAADVFTSFSDNIQESFGLAPVEAMAAGLPVVVSDWDGYRDTVVPGESGFSVPTAMPEAGSGAGVEFALRYLAGVDNYDQYIGRVGQCTAVDVVAATEAYVTLIENEPLRLKMGEAGARRARAVFDWSVVIPAYQALWTELAARRKADKGGAWGAGYPLRGDPFSVFAAFPTQGIGAATGIEAAGPDPMRATLHIAGADMNNFALKFMFTREEFERLFGALPEGRRARLRELQALFPAARHPALLRTLGWLAKGGVLRLTKG